MSELFGFRSESVGKAHAKHPAIILLVNKCGQPSYFSLLPLNPPRIMSKPQFLSGDKAAIEAFLSRFDVGIKEHPTIVQSADQLLKVFLFDCDGMNCPSLQCLVSLEDAWTSPLKLSRQLTDCEEE